MRLSAELTAVGTIGAVVLTLSVISLRLLVKGTRRWANIENSIVTMQRDFSDHVSRSDKVHDSMMETMREDRRATNARLTFMERERMQG